MMGSHGDDDAEIEAEIQKELDALKLEDLDDSISSEEDGHEEDAEINELTNELPECIQEFILRVQSRTNGIQQDISDCDALLSKVIEVTEEEKEEYFYQSKELKEFAFQIGEDPEELRDRVLQELATEDEEDTKPLPLDGPGVKILALEGPLFEGNDDLEDNPMLPLEGPSAEARGGDQEVVLAESGTVEVYVEPIQRFEETAQRSVRDFEERFDSQLKEYQEDYEESQRSRVRRERLAEEDRARRRRENNEEQRKLAARRMIEKSKMQEKLVEDSKATQQYLDQYQNEIKLLDAKTKREKLAFLEQRLEYQKMLADKMSRSAVMIQAFYRSYRARKPYSKKLKQIKEDVRKKMADKRQMEIAAERRLEEQKKKKERDKKRRREEEERRKAEEDERRRSEEREDEERRKRAREERERAERERLVAEEEERKRKEEERIEQERKTTEEKANEILAKIMREKKQAEEAGQETRQEVGQEAGVAVKVNIVTAEHMNIHKLDCHSQLTERVSAMKGAATRTESLVTVGYDFNSSNGDHMNKLHLGYTKKDSTLKDGMLDFIPINKLEKDRAFSKANFETMKGEEYSENESDLLVENSTEPVTGRDKTTSELFQEDDISSRNNKGANIFSAGKIVKSQEETQNLSKTCNEYSLDSDQPMKTDDSNDIVMNYSFASKIETAVQGKKTHEYSSHADQPMKTDDSNDIVMKYSLASKIETAVEGKKQHEYSSPIGNDDQVPREGGPDQNTHDSKLRNDHFKKDKLSTRNGPDFAGDSFVDDDDGGQMTRDYGADLSGEGKGLQEVDDGCAGNILSESSQNEMNDGRQSGTYLESRPSIDSTNGKDETSAAPRNNNITDKENLSEEFERARRRWMETSTSFSKQLIKAKDRLRSLEKEKRKYLRRPSSSKKMAAISEEKLLEASLVAKTLAEVTTIELVNLPGCTLKTVKQCHSLNAIRCRSSDIRGLEGMDNSPNVTFIDFKGNQLTSVNCRDLCNLTFLDLSNNNLSSIHGLEGCSSLKWLNYSSNKISRLNGIEHLLHLSHLDVSKNQLVNCQSLSSLVHLVSLNLSTNHLSAIPDLDVCPLLQILNFTNNSISELPPLSNHVMLTELLLDNNSLFSMETMKSSWLPSLQYLSLSQNSLPIIPVLDFAFSLKKLDLQNNYITDLQSLSDGLLKLPYLDHLYIDGNPVTEELNYKNEVLKLSPTLISLDDEEMRSSSAYPHPVNQFEEMCLSQIITNQALQERHLTIMRSTKDDENQLQQEATTWSAYLEYSLKMAVDHRYMHEYGDISPVTCSTDDLCRMIPDLIYNREGQIRNTKYNTRSDNLTRPSGDTGHFENDLFDGIGGSIYKSNRDPEIEKQLLPKNRSQRISEGATKERNKSNRDHDGVNQRGSVNDIRTSAAVKIQSVWRGFQVRQEIELHSERFLAALSIQAAWRGHVVRKRYRKARAALQLEKSEEADDEFHFNEDAELDFLAFNEESLEEGWLAPEMPQIPMVNPVLPQRYPVRDHPPNHRPMSSVSLMTSPSPEKFVPHPPKQAWKGGSSPLSPQRNDSSTPHDMGPLSGKPPLPPVTPMTHRGESSMGTTSRTGKSKKEEQISEEWGFRDSSTAELMLKRARKMKEHTKQILDPVQKYQMMKKNQDSQRGRVVQTKRGVQRKDYFKARAEPAKQKQKNVQDRTFQWVHSHAPLYQGQQASPVINPSLGLRNQHSSSEPNLPRMSPDVLQGRVQLMGSPSLDLQSVDGSSVHGLPTRERSSSLSFQDGERNRLPPLKINSAPTSHVRQQQQASSLARTGQRACGASSPQIKKR